MKTVLQLIILVTLAPTAVLAHATTCENLGSLRLPETTITTVQAVAPGALTVPGSFSSDAWADLPAFCRVRRRRRTRAPRKVR